MITGIAHLSLEVEDVRRTATDYAAVLGRNVAIDQLMSVRLQLDNVALDLSTTAIATAGVSTQLRLVLATADIEKAAHRLARRGLPVTVRQNTRVLDINASATHGVPISLAATRGPAAACTAADIAGLDHVVIRTPDPERAVALYGGRLGLDLRLDRANPEFGSRILFFVCGDLVVEITHETKKGIGSGADRVWGLAWRSNDLDRAHARMAAAGVDVSEIRVGRRAGTRVFTVKSHTAGVPMLVIGGDGLHRA